MNNMHKNLQNFIIWAQNKPGVLFRILWLFRRKQLNIESVTAGHSEIPDITRITITVSNNGNKVKNMVHQLNKLVNVVKVEHLDTAMLVYREMALIKIALSEKEEKSQVLRIIEHFRGRVINMTNSVMVIEATGDENKIDAFYENIKNFNIVEFVRTGRAALLK